LGEGKPAPGPNEKDCRRGIGFPRGRVSEGRASLGPEGTDAVFEEVSIAWFEGYVLRVLFPLTLSIYAELDCVPGHTKPLQDAAEAVYDKRPTEVRCEVHL
jgi:hypothetical protein